MKQNGLHVEASALAAEVTMPKLAIDSAIPPYTMLFRISHDFEGPCIGANIGSLVAILILVSERPEKWNHVFSQIMAYRPTMQNMKQRTRMKYVM